MPLFGPNIKKMKEKGDIQSLTKELTNKNPTIRVEAAEALKSIDDPKAVAVVTKYISDLLRFGERDDQIEAILLIQARAPEHFLPINVDPKRVQKKLSLEPFRDALFEVIKRHKSAVSVWYALIALIELGDRSHKVLNGLIEFTKTWLANLDTEGIEGAPTWALAKSINEETLRALSYFKGNQTAVNAVIDALEGKLFGSYVSEDETSKAILRIIDKDLKYAEDRVKQGDEAAKTVLEVFHRSTFNEVKIKSAIYALGALGDQSTRERLEYLASRGSESIRKSVKVALEFFGKATYDEIKAKAESK
jgi:HEAT repeat protein